MKKKYIAPQVKEVKIRVEQLICAGSIDIGYGDEQKDPIADIKEDYGWEEWSLDWDDEK